MVQDRREWMAEGGRRLRGRRTDLGLSVEDVASFIGRSPGQVARYESGASNPMTPTVSVRYARALLVVSLSKLYLDGVIVEAGRPEPSASPLDYWCPTCGSQIGEPCSTASDVYLKPSKSHAARKAAAMRGGR